MGWVKHLFLQIGSLLLFNNFRLESLETCLFLLYDSFIWFVYVILLNNLQLFIFNCKLLVVCALMNLLINDLGQFTLIFSWLSIDCVFCLNFLDQQLMIWKKCRTLWLLKIIMIVHTRGLDILLLLVQFNQVYFLLNHHFSFIFCFGYFEFLWACSRLSWSWPLLRILAKFIH